MGFVASVKKGIEISKGEKIAIHGSGDYSSTRRIEKQIEYLKKNPSIGVVGCYVKKKDITNNRESYHKPFIPKNNLIEYLKNRNPFLHGEVMFDKNLYNQVGGYRVFFKYAQDRDLWMRMASITKFGCVPEFLYTRYNLPESVSKSPEKVVMQKVFNEISRQCLESKDKGEKDLIEKYGQYAPFFLNNNKRLSKEILKKSIDEYHMNNLVNAYKINEINIQKKRTTLNTLFKIFITFSLKSKTFKDVFEKIIKFSKFFSNKK